MKQEAAARRHCCSSQSRLRPESAIYRRMARRCITSSGGAGRGSHTEAGSSIFIAGAQPRSDSICKQSGGGHGLQVQWLSSGGSRALWCLLAQQR